jgi:signal transduction histidine kinase
LVINGVPSDYDAERYAALIFSHRVPVLEAWCELARISEAGPATEFIRSQLDASVLALANWFLGTDPQDSAMGRQWAGMKPSQEMTVGAVVSMSLLPEAVRQGVSGVADEELARLTRSVSEFTGLMAHRLVEFGPESDGAQWDKIAAEVEEYYEAQRIQRVRRLSVLTEIAHAVSTGQDLDTLFEQVQQSVIQISGSDYIEISLLDSEIGMLRCQLVYGHGQRQHLLEGTLADQGLSAEVLKHGKPLIVSDYLSACQQRGIEPSTALSTAPQRGWMGSPMWRGDDVVGVISVSGRLTSYDPEDVELLTAIARQTAVALENRHLIEAQRRHLSQLSAVNQLARETAQLRDSGDLMRIATNRIHEFFGYDLVSVFLGSRNGDALNLQSRSPRPPELENEASSLPLSRTSVVGTVAIERSASLIGDVREHQAFVPTESTRGSLSEMTVPIIHADRLLGVLDVQSERLNAFDSHDLTTLQTVADQLAVGLENSRLFSDEAQRSRELGLMLETTRAAGSSLLLDEVLERLAEGLANAAEAPDCLILLFSAEDQTLSPAARYTSDPAAQSCPLCDWNRILSIAELPELEQAMKNVSPQLICRIPRRQVTASSPIFLVPLRSRRQMLGLAIITCPESSQTSYPERQMRLLQGVADSTALAVENARLYARAHGLAIAEERGRLAQEIHDTLAQGLTAISLQLDLADSYLPGDPEKASKNVQRALDLTRENLNQARRSVLDLRAADVHQMSLPDAISQLVRRLGDQSETEFEFINDGLMSRLSARVEVGLYRILEEALENARRHSDAQRVRVEIEADGKTVSLIVEDDGQGFDPASLTSDGDGDHGFGLLGIRERARILGGSFTISSTPGSGTTLRIVVPYEARLQSSSAGIQQQGELV